MAPSQVRSPPNPVTKTKMELFSLMSKTLVLPTQSLLSRVELDTLILKARSAAHLDRMRNPPSLFLNVKRVTETSGDN